VKASTVLSRNRVIYWQADGFSSRCGKAAKPMPRHPAVQAKRVTGWLRRG